MGMGAMMCAMLGLPLSSVLLTTIFMGSDGVDVMPLVIVAVVVTYVGRAHFSPRPRAAREATAATPADAPTTRAAAGRGV